MGKKLSIPNNYRVEVTPRRLGDYGYFSLSERIYTQELSNEMRQRCEQIANEIKRHVDYVSLVEVKFDQEEVCEFCGATWTEDTPHNGGCCDKDCELMDDYEAKS